MRLTPAEWDLIRDYWPHVRAVAARYAGPGRDADEIESAVQWGLICAAVGWPADPDPAGDFGTRAICRMHWAAQSVAWYSSGWSVVRGSGHSSRRHGAAREPFPGGGIVCPAASAAARAIDADDEFEALIGWLAEPDRTIVRLTYRHDLDAVEVGRAVGMPAEKVRYRLRCAGIELRKWLRHRDRHQGVRRAVREAEMEVITPSPEGDGFSGHTGQSPC